MGDPKFMKKKFSAPPHPWQKSRIEEEKGLIREFGLKNKSEVWKMGAKVRQFAGQAKSLTAQTGSQSKKEESQLLSKLYRLNLLPKGSTIDNVLGLTIKDVLERRLQTIVFKKGLVKSVKQARQFITHRHVAVGEKVITSPSYIVSAEEEGKVTFINKSSLSDAEHPERAVEKRTPGDRPKKGKAAEEEKEKPKTREAVEAKEEKSEEQPADKEGAKAEEKSEEAKE